MKRVIKNLYMYIIITVMLFFLGSGIVECDTTYNATYDTKDVTNGRKTYATTEIGGGKWYSGCVGVKVSIYKGNTQLVSKRFANVGFSNSVNTGACSNVKYTGNTVLPKFEAYSIKWVDFFNFEAITLPKLDTNWDSFYKENNYENLKKLVVKMTENTTTTSFDAIISNPSAYYIIIEPMANIADYFGTAYELSKSFMFTYDTDTHKTNFNCDFSDSDNYCYVYSTVFGEYFYNNVFLKENVNNTQIPKLFNGLTECKGSDGVTKNICFYGPTGGRGIGVYQFSNETTTSFYCKEVGGIYYDNNGNKVSKTDYEKICNIPSTGETWKLEVQKINEKSELITSSPATFKVVCGNTINGNYSTGNTGKLLIDNIPVGTTCEVKEIQAPNGYILDSTIQSITSNSKETKTFKITNKLSCEGELKITTHNVGNLLALYKKYGKKYNGLLNFNNPSCTKINRKVSLDNSCTSSKIYNQNFDINNWSGFDEEYENNGNLTFCSIVLEIKTNALSEIFPSTSFFASKEDPIKLGQILSLTENPSVSISRQCYSNNGKFANINTPTFQDYASEFKILGKSITSTTKKIVEAVGKYTEVETKEDSKSGIYGRKLTVTRNYLFDNSISHLTGKSGCTNNCLIKSGLITKFTFNNSKLTSGTLYLYPNIKLNSNFIKLKGDMSLTRIESETIIDNNCKYNYEEEIVVNNKINVEFRIIDTKHPFPGLSGTNRYRGTNWISEIEQILGKASSRNLDFAAAKQINSSISISDFDYNGDGKKNINDELLYEKYKDVTTDSAANEAIKYNEKIFSISSLTSRSRDAIYKITLTPDLMKQIRTYNSEKKHIYDSYDITTKSNKKTVNSFFARFNIQKKSV